MLRGSTRGVIQSVSRGFLSTECSLRAGPVQFVRGARKKDRSVSPTVQRAILQLSVLSANRKLPRVLKLSNEDLVRHETVQRGWIQYQVEKRTLANAKLEKQYESAYNAMEDLRKVSPGLFRSANQRQNGKRFPLDSRIPTDYPPNKIWYYDYKPIESAVPSEEPTASKQSKE